ncbi:Abi-alpha family protein [Sinorhizobium meliloti]|uniref:Abi-alpha family protein n=1 Tax=Rhizobium meliloti TaxID=382 RepID=UPI001F164B26|nr:Abi-alpha family protein [Sinorhizobium meliloti]
MSNEIQKAPEITLLKSEMEAAAARVAERAMNTTFDGIAGVVGDVFGGLFGDGVKQWRTRRLVTTLVKTKEHLETSGIPIEKAKSLPMGELYAIFEGASKQDDPNLTEMWAALLANAMNPNNARPLDPAFPKLLERMSGLDALILNFYLESAQEHADLGLDKVRPTLATANFGERRLEYMRFIEERGTRIENEFGSQNVSHSISNLLRLGLLFVETKFDRSSDLVTAEMLRDEHIRVNTSELKGELANIYYHLDLMSDNVPDHKIVHYYNIGQERRWFLPYYLTNVAKRLLEACR